MLVRSAIDRKTNKNTAKLLQFPEDLGAHGMLMVFKDYDFVSPGNRNLLDVKNTNVTTSAMNTILLPIPNNLQENTETTLNRVDLRFLGDVAASAIDDAIQGGQLTLDSSVQALKNMVNTASGTDLYNSVQQGNYSELGGGVSYLLKRMGAYEDIIKKMTSYSIRSSETVGNVLSVSEGFAINPKAALSFNGVELRRHNLSWQLSPRSSEEVESLNKIIKLIKQKQLPEYGGDFLGGDLFFKYPSTVDIFLIGVSTDYYLKYKTSMINNFVVNYNPHNNLSILKGGTPASISIEMNLTEMEIHTSEDYTDGLNETDWQLGGDIVNNPQ